MSRCDSKEKKKFYTLKYHDCTNKQMEILFTYAETEYLIV